MIDGSYIIFIQIISESVHQWLRKVENATEKAIENVFDTDTSKKVKQTSKSKYFGNNSSQYQADLDPCLGKF